MLNAIPFSIRSLLTLVTFCIFISACNSSGVDEDLASFEVRLYDAPLDSVQEVNIFVEHVEINRGDSSEIWTTVHSPNRSFDLLELTNGAFEIIGDTLLEPDNYSQIRLILGETGNNIVINDSSYSLQVPSGAQTGIKLNIEQELEANKNYVLLLDFDVAKSIVQTGNSQSGIGYLLQPVIRANFQSQTGDIAGVIDPAEARPIIYAIQETDTLASTFADTLNGEFKLVGLPEGIYRVSIEPRNEEYVNMDINDVQVNLTETTDLGTIQVNEDGILGL